MFKVILVIVFIAAAVLISGMILDKKNIIKGNKFTKDENNNSIPDIVEDTIENVKKKIKK